MKKWFCTCLVAFGIVAATAAYGDALQPPEPSVSVQFTPGQVWRYKTRPNEEASRVIIGKVEKAPKVGIIVHVKLVGLRLKNPTATDGVSTEMGHAPMSEAAMAKSVIAITNDVPDLEGFSHGYDTWLASYQEGTGGIFTIKLSEVVASVEQVLNGRGGRVIEEP